jgi:hypothetical protein
MTSIHASLNPGESKVVEVTAAFVKPNVYDLNRWKMNVYLGDNTGKSKTSTVGEATFTHVPNVPRFVTVTTSANLR